MTSMAREEFDWIDDAFDEKKTAEDMEAARGPKLAGVLLLVVVILSVALVVFGLIGIVGSLQALQ